MLFLWLRGKGEQGGGRLFCTGDDQGGAGIKKMIIFVIFFWFWGDRMLVVNWGKFELGGLVVGFGWVCLNCAHIWYGGMKTGIWELGMNVGVCWLGLVRFGFYLNQGKRTGFVEVSCYIS